MFLNPPTRRGNGRVNWQEEQDQGRFVYWSSKLAPGHIAPCDEVATEMLHICQRTPIMGKHKIKQSFGAQFRNGRTDRPLKSRCVGSSLTDAKSPSIAAFCFLSPLVPKARNGISVEPGRHVALFQMLRSPGPEILAHWPLSSPSRGSRYNRHTIAPQSDFATLGPVRHPRQLPFSTFSPRPRRPPTPRHPRHCLRAGNVTQAQPLIAALSPPSAGLPPPLASFLTPGAAPSNRECLMLSRS